MCAIFGLLDPRETLTRKEKQRIIQALGWEAQIRGTLKRNTLLASLELVDKICHLALYLSDEEMQGLAWTTFVSSLREQDCPELVQYLKERRLYTNAPVAAEEEV